ncbi:MAG TPA: hypothetical protein VIP11_15665, partial [Gemmatimonadaceae bacterium]
MSDADARERWTMNRREFIHLAGASLALAGLDGCTRMPAEHILPYVDNRPELTPGVGAYYATAMPMDGIATGLIVQSHAGRPTKVEGNPEHPASLGATGPFEQASVLQLYDPDRARDARIGSSRTTWDAIAAQLAPSALRQRVGARGTGLHILIEPTSSLLDEELLARVLESHPDARIYMYAPLVGDRSANPVVPHYDIAATDVIVAVDSDFLSSGPFHVRYARQFADNRRLVEPTSSMNRLYAIESAFTPTGAAADHRFAARPSEIPDLLVALRSALAAGADPTAVAPRWLGLVAQDVRANAAGRSVVIVGEHQPADVRAIGDAINDAIGATNRLAWHAPSPLIGGRVPMHSLGELVIALAAKAVDTLVIVGGNPSYATPAALEFRTLLRAVPNSGYIGLYENETARDVRWFVPMSHYLESWGDTRAYDGTISIVQPLVNPLYRSTTPAEVYAALGGMGVVQTHDLLRSSWTRRTPGDAEAAWADALQRGIVTGTEFPRAPRPTI